MYRRQEKAKHGPDSEETMASNKAKLTGPRELLPDQTLMVKTGSRID